MLHHDQLVRFNFDELDIRGELVYLNESWQQVLARYEYPAPVRQQLGNALAALVLLSATIKYDGNMILQVQGDGPLKKLVAQVTHDGSVRGLARWEGLVPMHGSLQQIFGNGRILITVFNANGERYQSIVAMEGHTLADALNVYFLQSEQLPSTFKLITADNCVAGFFLQQLPDSRSTRDKLLAEGKSGVARDRDEDWNRINILAGTVEENELVSLNPERLLHRLFHEEQVRLHAPKRMRFSCTCSRSKVESTLLTMGRAEVDDIIRTEGKVDVDCEFCQQRYVFKAPDIDALFNPADNQLPPDAIVH